MKRFLTIAAVVLFASSAMAQGDYLYGWTISNSAVDPFANTGAPVMGVATLYVWFNCSVQDGMSAAEFDLTGTISSLAWTFRVFSCPLTRGTVLGTPCDRLWEP